MAGRLCITPSSGLLARAPSASSPLSISHGSFAAASPPPAMGLDRRFEMIGRARALTVPAGHVSARQSNSRAAALRGVSCALNSLLSLASCVLTCREAMSWSHGSRMGGMGCDGCGGAWGDVLLLDRCDGDRDRGP